MNRRIGRIALWVLAICVGVGVAAWGTLRLLGFGPAVVVVTNVGSARVESLTIAEVSEGMRELLVEHAPVRLGPGESATIHLERTSDAEIEVRITDATGAARRVRVHVYLSHGRALTLEIDVADGVVKEARARRGKDAAFQRATWTSD